MNVFYKAGETAVDLFEITVYTVKKEYGKMLVFLQLCIPVATYYLCNNSVRSCFIWSVLLNIFLEFIRRFSNKLANKSDDGFPIHQGQRYTKTVGDSVMIESRKAEEAILYLQEVEDYMYARLRK